MINGVPQNDMENGWVYWSNWDGVGDVHSSIQMQKRSIVKSYTINWWNDEHYHRPSSTKKGGKFKQEVGRWIS